MATIPDGAFAFGIPLQSPVGCPDWRAVTERVIDTVASCLRQTADNVFVVICGHEFPRDLTARYYGDPRVSYIESPLGPPKPNASVHARILDMALKNKTAAVACGEMWGAHGHFMILDADDVVSDTFVATIRELAPQEGVIVQGGYIWYLQQRILVSLPAENGETFDQACGSSAVFFFGRNDFPSDPSDCMPCAGPQNRNRGYNQIGGHKSWEHAFKRQGRSFKFLTSPEVIYTRSHGANNSAINAQGQFHNYGFRASEKGPQIMSAEMIRRQNIPARFHIELRKLTMDVE